MTFQLNKIEQTKQSYKRKMKESERERKIKQQQMLALFVIHKNGLVFDSMANPLSKCCRTTTTAVMLVVCACLHQNRLDELFNWIRLVNNVIKICCDGMCSQLNYLISFLIDRQCCVRLIWIKNLCEMPKRPKRKTNKQQQRKKLTIA